MCRPFIAIVVLSASLSACASVDGAPKPVISVAEADSLRARYPVDQVIAQIDTYQTDNERRAYRNRVITTYLMDADAKYQVFLRSLSHEVKYSNIGLDFATLALTGAASVWGTASKTLAAGATALAGGRASLNKELYFEKTLPALESLMDSRRLTVKSEILKGLSQPESTYTIHDAFADVSRYQSAGTIDGAIQEVAATAAQQAKDAKLDYSKALALCDVPEDVATGRQNIMFALEDEADKADAAKDAAEATQHRTTIQKAAAAAGAANPELAPTTEATNAQLRTISNYLLTVCSKETLASFQARLAQAGVKLP